MSRIIYRHCANCHREDGAAMSLMIWEQARPWAKAIKEEVLQRRMPPWGAVKGFGDFANDNSLSQEEMNLIAEWVEGGAPEGDPNFLPPAPRITTPRLELKGSRLPIDKRTVLASQVRVTGIYPVGSTASTQVVATLPDGSMEPLLWLFGYKSEWRRTFVYRTPVSLPKGTVLTVNPPARLELITANPSQRR